MASKTTSAEPSTSHKPRWTRICRAHSRQARCWASSSLLRSICGRHYYQGKGRACRHRPSMLSLTPGKTQTYPHRRSSPRFDSRGHHGTCIRLHKLLKPVTFQYDPQLWHSRKAQTKLNSGSLELWRRIHRQRWGGHHRWWSYSPCLSARWSCQHTSCKACPSSAACSWSSPSWTWSHWTWGSCCSASAW